MPKDKELKENYEKALKWCKEARDILKIKRSGPRRDLKEQEYRQLDVYIQLVSDGLKKLQKAKSPKHEELMKQFIKQAATGQVAQESQNKELAKMLNLSLQNLHSQIEVALGTRDPRSLEGVRNNLKERETDLYDDAMRKAKEIKDSLERLSRGVHQFVGQVPTYISAGEYHFKSGNPGATAFALLNLGKTPAEKVEQLERHRLYTKYQEKLLEATKLESQLKLADTIKNTSLTPQVSQVIKAAELLCNEEFKYTEATVKLKEVDKASSQAMKGLSKEDKKLIEGVLEARNSFEEKYVSEFRRVDKAKPMRGMNEPPAKGFLDEASVLLSNARLTVDTTADITEIKNAEKSLDRVEPLVEKATEASKSAKEDSTANLEAMAKWLKLLPTAERDYKSIQNLRGTDTEQSQLFQLIALAKQSLKNKGPVVLGYEDAVKVLAPYPTIVEDARKKNKQLMEAELPKAVAEVGNELYEAIYRLAGHSPKFLSDLRLEEMKQLSGNIRITLTSDTDPTKKEQAEKDAISEIRKLVVAVNETIDEQLKLETKAKEAWEAYKKLQSRLRDKGILDDMLATPYRMASIAHDRDMYDREWSRAIEKLRTATGLCTEIENYFDQHASTWKINEKKIHEFKDLARKLVLWIPLAGPARSLLDDCNGLEAQLRNTFDFVACTTEFTNLRLQERHDSLLKRSEGLPSQEVLSLLAESLRDWTQQVRARSSDVMLNSIMKIEEKLEGVVDPRVNSLRLECDEALASWESYRLDPKPDVRLVETAYLDTLNKFKDIEKRAQTVLNDPQALEQFQSQIKSDDKTRYMEDLPKLILSLIDKLEDIPKAELSRRQLTALQKSGGATAKSYEDFRDSLLKDLDIQRRKVQVKFDGAMEMANLADQSLKAIKGRHKNFQPYQEALESQLLDIKTMIASGDLDMLEIARKSLKEVVLKISSVHPDQRSESDGRYHEVEELWARLSGMLGLTKTMGGAILIENRLPDTYKKLRSDLENAILQAKKSAPKEGLAILRKLDAPIREAYQRASRLDDEHERFKERRRQLEDNWSAVKKKTSTRVTEKTTALANYIESRLNEAEQLRHSETGIEGAKKILGELEKMVTDILNLPDSEMALERIRELDEKHFREQELVRDVARQFGVEVKNFKEVLLESTRVAIRKNEATGKIRSADMNDSLDMVNRLEKQADSAAKMVSPYMANIEKLPHKRIGSDAAPEVEKALEKFQQARSILDEGKRTADRLAGATMTTNVNISEDFGKVQKNWADQVKQFAATVNEISTLIDTTLQEFGRSGDFDTEEFKKLEENATAAKKLLEQIRGHFSAAAFERPFSILQRGESSGTKNEKLTAREEALRVMRQYREDVLQNPLLRKLTDKSNPFGQPKMVAATGYLRAALKRIEIETLIGV